MEQGITITTEGRWDNGPCDPVADILSAKEMFDNAVYIEPPDDFFTRVRLDTYVLYSKGYTPKYLCDYINDCIRWKLAE